LLSHKNQTEGSYFQILCAVQEGSHPLFFEWFKNGHSIKANPDVNYKIDNFEKYSTLIIAKIDRKDAGNYSCVVHNSIGSDSQSVLLSIKCRKLLFSMIFEIQIYSFKISSSELGIRTKRYYSECQQRVET
jgi:hypothetical protein